MDIQTKLIFKMKWTKKDLLQYTFKRYNIFPQIVCYITRAAIFLHTQCVVSFAHIKSSFFYSFHPFHSRFLTIVRIAFAFFESLRKKNLKLTYAHTHTSIPVDTFIFSLFLIQQTCTRAHASIDTCACSYKLNTNQFK